MRAQFWKNCTKIIPFSNIKGLSGKLSSSVTYIWPSKNYRETLFTPFKLFEFRVLVFLKSIARVPFQSSCAKNIL